MINSQSDILKKTIDELKPYLKHSPMIETLIFRIVHNNLELSYDLGFNHGWEESRSINEI